MRDEGKKVSTLAGQQTFDGLGRQLTVVVGGRTTLYEYVGGQMPPSANVLPDGKRIDYTYEADLDHQITCIAPSNEASHGFTFDKRLALPATSSGPLGTHTSAYTPSGQPATDTWTVDGKAHKTTWRHALGGLAIGFDDADGVTHERRYDAFGRLDQVKAGTVTRDFSYDELDRLHSSTTLDPASGNQLVQTLSYDALGREHTRTFAITQGGSTRTIVQTLAYTTLDQLASRQWKDGSQTGEETFAYDVRNRLTTYTANATAAATDPFGNKVIKQTFEFNVLDGYTKVVSTFADNSTDTATFSYSADDPTQITSIAHSHASWPAKIDLTYDACGRVTHYAWPATGSRPALDRTLTWDAQSRLIKVDDKNNDACLYGYNPAGQLSDRTVKGTLTRSFFSGDQPTHEQTGDKTLRLHGDGGGLFALSKLAAGVHQATTLLGSDAQGSVRIEADSHIRTRLYTAHGAEAANDDNGPYGFAGERRDELTGWYIPSGYRPYDPIVMGFLSPDSDSPFGQGGLNPYAYCGGDPVNRIDPSGHGWEKWVFAGVGLVLGIIGTVSTFGALGPALAGGILTLSGMMAISGAAMSAVSLGTGIAASVLDVMGKDEKTATILGIVSMGTGLVGTGLEMGAARLAAKAAASKPAVRLIGMKRGSVSRGSSSSANSLSSSNSTAPRWIGNSEVLHTTGDDMDMVFHRSLWGDGTVAFETHGARTGELMNTSGRMVPAREVAETVIAPRVAKMNLPKDEPILLLACHGGKSGAAQEVANVLGRPVKGASRKIYVKDPKTMNARRAADTTSKARTNIPTEAVEAGERPFFSDNSARRLAEFKTYYPTRFGPY